MIAGVFSLVVLLCRIVCQVYWIWSMFEGEFARAVLFYLVANNVRGGRP